MPDDKPTPTAPCAHDDHNPSECTNCNVQDATVPQDANDHDSAASATSSSSNSEGSPSDWEVVTSSEEGSPVIPQIEPPSPSSNETELPILANGVPGVETTAHISTFATSLDAQKLPTEEGEAHISTHPSHTDSAEASKPFSEDAALSDVTDTKEKVAVSMVEGFPSIKIDDVSSPTATPEDTSSSPRINEEEYTPAPEAPVESASSVIDTASANPQNNLPTSETVLIVSAPESAVTAPSDSTSKDKEVQATDPARVDAGVQVSPVQEGSPGQVEGAEELAPASVAPGAEANSNVAPTVQAEATAAAPVSEGDTKPAQEILSNVANAAAGAAALSVNDAASAGSAPLAPSAPSEPSDATPSASQPSVIDTPPAVTAGENVAAGDVSTAPTPQVSEGENEPMSDSSTITAEGAVAPSENGAVPAEAVPSDTTASAGQPSVVVTGSDTPLTAAAETMVTGDAGDAPSANPASDSAPQGTGGDAANSSDTSPTADPTTTTVAESANDAASGEAKVDEGDTSSDTPKAESSAETPATSTEKECEAVEPPSERPSPPPPPPPVLPPGTAKRILQPFTNDQTPTNTPAGAPSIAIPESILEEISATIAYSLSPTAQEKAWKATKDRLEDGDDLERIHEQMVHLCYPYAHCHDVVDEALRGIARRQKADLVTIDVLDLAMMEYGPLGKKTAEAVKQLYSGKYYKKGVDESVQDVFDALVQVQPEEQVADASSSAQRRIVYIKDFGTTIVSSNRLLCRVLRAIHKRRSTTTPLLPTILVLGYVKSFDITSTTLEAFAQGGNNLRTLIERPGDKMYLVPWGYKPFPGPLPNFCTTYFLKSTLSKKDINGLSESSISNREKLKVDHYQLYAGAYFSVFPQGDGDKEKNREVERRMAERRRCDVFDKWMKVCLAHRGGEGPECAVRYFADDASDAAAPDVDYALVAKNVDNLATKLGCVNLSVIDRVVITAIGIASTPEEEVAPAKEAQEDSTTQEAPAAQDVTPTSDPEVAPVTEVKEEGAVQEATPSPEQEVSPVKEAEAGAGAAQEEVPTPEATPALDPEVTAPAEEVAQKVTLVKVTPSHISKAYALVLGGLDVREKWYKEKHPEVEKSEDKDSDDEEEPEEEAVDIVAKVKAASDLTEHEKQLLGSIVDTGRLASSFDDISVPECVIETLRTIITLPLLFPEAFSSGLLQREAMSGVLLYGPPGTGKTLLCRIAARECGARMLLIKPSDIMNQWVGESEKLVNAIFSLANRLAPCIVFIDEVDSCFRARSGDDKKWIRDIMSEFLQAMDGLVSSRTEEGGVLVIGATNRPYDIDDAIIRRLPSRMLIGAPGVTEREAILKIHLKGEALDSETDLSDIARMTTDYSGSDLKNLCVSAAMASLKEAVGKIDWSQVSSLSKKQTKKSEPVKDQAEEPKAEEQESGVDAAKEKVKARSVKMAHFKQAMKEVAPSSSAGSHRELYRWHERFGSVSR